ncbi:hypothetical protein XENOCAPTIV_015472 [Xenoophorus captivus]|uniref:Uncharacterized protein n=1 Tax=Xenoophorus captivus TaxID=1517983 RepID=A0ABV0RHG7_9TELE
MVNTSVTLPQSKDRSGSTRSDFEIVPRFTCLACPPGGTHWHSTLACQPLSPGLAHVSPEPTRSPTSKPGPLAFDIKNHLAEGNRSLFLRWFAGGEREPVIGRRRNVLPPLRERVWMSRKHGWSDPDGREWLEISSPERAAALEGRRDAQEVRKPRAATTQADGELYHVIT